MRLVRQGAVRIDGEKITDKNYELHISTPLTITLKVGRKRFLKLTFE